MLRLSALCSTPTPGLLACSSTKGLSVGSKQTAQSLGGLRRFAQTLPYVLSTPTSISSDPISTLLLNAQILQPCTQALQQSSPNIEVSLQNSSLCIHYRPAWFQTHSTASRDVSETEYDTPIPKLTSREGEAYSIEAIAQHLQESTKSVHTMLLSLQRPHASISNALLAIFQDLVSLQRAIHHSCSSGLPQTQWKPLLDTYQQDEKDAFDGLDTSLQAKIALIDLAQLSVSMELYAQLRQPESCADQSHLPTFTAERAESLLLRSTDTLAVIFHDTEHAICSANERLVLLEVAGRSFQMFYSSACQVIPGTYLSDLQNERYFLASISRDLLNRQIHLLLDLLGSKDTSSAACTDVTSIFSAILNDNQATMLFSEIISSTFGAGVHTSSASRSATEHLVQSILEHAADATVSIKDELHKPSILYRNLVLPRSTVKPPSILVVLVKILTLPINNSSSLYIMHPKLVFQTLLQQLSVITSQKHSMKDSLITLTALSYQYMLELAILTGGSSVLWKDLPPMIVSSCDKQFSSQLPSQAILTFMRLMFDMLGFLFLLALRNESSTQAKQCSTQLLSFFLSFFSIISRNIHLQIHIISLLTRLSTTLQLAKSNTTNAAVPLDTSTTFLQAIDSCLMDIYIGTISSISPSISLLDASLTSLAEPIQNGRFLPEYIVQIRLLSKLKELLRTIGSLSLIKSIVQLFVLLVDRYYVDAQISTVSLALQLNTIMAVIMSIVIFTRDNTIAIGIVSILLPAMRATLPPIGATWKDGHNSISRSTGLLLCITSQTENRLLSFLRTVIGLADQHRTILRDVQREVLRIVHGFLSNFSTQSTPPYKREDTSTGAVPFSLFPNATLALTFFNLCGFSIILADELGDNREEAVPLCVSQKEQCLCKLANRYTTASTELEPKIKHNAVPPYGKPKRSGALRSSTRSMRQTGRGPDATAICSADSTASMLLSITRTFTDILPNILQCTVLPDSIAPWIEAYITKDEHRKFFQTHAFRVISLGARIHVHCLCNAEMVGGSSAHMTTGSLLSQYNSIMSVLCFMVDAADVYVIEHVVSCLVQYARWDLFYRGDLHGTQSLYILCKTYIRICMTSNRQLVHAGYLKKTSELACLSINLHDSPDKTPTAAWSIAKHLYLLTLLARGLNQLSEKEGDSVRTVLQTLLPDLQDKIAKEGLPIVYSTPMIYVLRLLMTARASAPDLIHFVTVCQYTLLGSLPFMFIQSTSDAAAMLASLTTDCSQPSLHPLIADAIFCTTVKFFSTHITEDIISSICSSIASEDTDSESKISLASLSVSTLKSPSSTTDHEKPLLGVYVSAKAEEKRLHVHKRFVHAILPYCHTILSKYYFKGLFPLSAEDAAMATKTIVHVLYCMRQIIASKLVLPECIVPSLLAFQLTACCAHNGSSMMTIVYEDVLDTLTLSLTVFKQVMCVVAIEKAIQLLFMTEEWKTLVRSVADKSQTETILQSIQVPVTVVTDLYNLFFLENDAIGVLKQKDADALFVSTALGCLELPDESNEGNWHDTLLRLFFLLYIFIKLPFCKHKSSSAVGAVIRYFSDYTVRQYQRILLLDSTGGETLAHTFVCDLFAYLADCIVKLFTYYFEYTMKGEKEEIGKEPRGDSDMLDDVARAVSQSMIGPDETLKELMKLRDSMS